MSAAACLLAPGPKRTDDLTAQWKRRTTLTTEAVFPHLRSRLEVVATNDIDLSPLDSAIDAIRVCLCVQFVGVVEEKVVIKFIICPQSLLLIAQSSRVVLSHSMCST